MRLAYAVHGELAPDATPLVLVHGFMGNSRAWNPVIQGLAARHTVITFDHRGHGESTHTGDPATYTFDQLLADMEQFVDGIGLGRFHLLGHSMGGVIAMRYAVEHQDRVASLIPMDTAAAASPDADEASVGFMRLGIEIVSGQGMQALFDHIDAQMPDIPEVVEFRANLRWDLLHMDPHAFVRFGNELLEYPSFLRRLAELTMPATVLVGANDLGLLDASRATADTIPDAVLRVIPDAAHNPQSENPAGWLAAVASHFDRVTREPSSSR